MSISLYHNPRCSKSRAALKLLTERGIEPEIIEYLKAPPDENGLRTLLDQLGMEPRELMRTKEAEYKDNGLDDPTLDRDALIRAMIAHPKLIERPILINADRAAIGRPPERILDIL
ncbi:MAG: arsenate reductase (glutaredoxin) [Thiohalocapsa sp.]